MPEEKTIGEMLKEEGLIKEEEEKEEIKPEPRQLDINKVMVELEKIRAVVDTLKAVKFEADERIKELAEAIGEVRSLFFQRDANIKEMQTKLEKLEETIKEIKPTKIEKSIKETEKEIDELAAKVEKIENISKDLNQRTSKTEKILEGIRSIENIQKLDEEIAEKLNKIEELKTSVERDAAKSERFYLESEKRVKEFKDVKEKLEKLDGLTKELVRNLDEIRIKLDSYVTKEDVSKLINEELKLGKRKEKLEEKEKKKEEIVTLLKNMKEQYKRGLISEDAYKEIVEKNESILENIEKELSKFKTEEVPQNLGEWLDYIERKIEELDINLSSNRKQIEHLSKKIKELSKENVHHFIPTHTTDTSILIDEVDEITNLLSDLEDQYRKGMISERTYREVKEKNLAKIKKIKSILNQEESDTEHREIEKKLNALKEKLEKMKRYYPLVIE